MMRENTVNAFFTLVRAGLWEKEACLVPFGEVDFSEVLKLSEEQSVVGLVAAGIEHVADMKPQKKDVLPFIGRTVQMERRNQAMNCFIGNIVEKMRAAGIYTVLVKGQGVGQCYSRPLWRACGDVDLFFDAENYEKAKAFLTPLASAVEPEEKRKKHLAMTIETWLVELHGLMPTEISERINAGVAQVQNDIFAGGGVRVWKNGVADVYLPSPDNDVIIVFTHFLQHFFVGGVGLRQICDWCRLLWTYRDSIDRGLLDRRLKEMGIVSEWEAFGAFAMEYLGLPLSVYRLLLLEDDVNLLETCGTSEQARANDNENQNDNEDLDLKLETWNLKPSLRRKARRISRVVMEAGNFGHNKDNSYRSKYPKLVEKSITFFRRLGEYGRLIAIFPMDAPRFFVTYVGRRTKAVVGCRMNNKDNITL